jgi:hypothetical protein
MVDKKQLREPSSGITGNVRISNKDDGGKVDEIISSLMKSRFFHAEHDPVLNECNTRKYIKDLVF